MQLKYLDEPLFDLQDVNFQARVNAVNMQIEKGECWHILGPNGAGKSSLLLLLAGVETPCLGELKLNGMPLSEYSLAQLAKTRCFLHQQQQSEFDIPLNQLLSFYTQCSTLPSLIDDYLHINSFLHKPLSSLSGGQQQRFHIARNLVQIWPAIKSGQAIVLLDEPMAHLDIKHQSAVMELLCYICDLGNTLIMSSHDVNISMRYASHVGLMYESRLAYHGLASEVLSLNNLHTVFEHKFTHIQGNTPNENYILSAAT